MNDLIPSPVKRFGFVTYKKKEPLKIWLGPEWGDVELTDDLLRKSMDYNAVLDYRMRNPETVLIDNGKTVRLFDAMMMDDAISSTINIKKRLILSTPYEFRPASESPEDIAISAFVENVLTRMKIRWLDALDNMLDARVYGYKCAEKVWAVEGDKYVLKNLKFRHSLLFDFEYDEFGNMSCLHVGYYFGGQHMAVRGADIQNKFLIFVYPYVRDGIYYGQSELREVYDKWLAKLNIQKFRNMYVQNYGQPFVKVVTDAKTISPEEKSDIQEMLEHLQENQWIEIPATRNEESGQLIPKAELEFVDVTKGSPNTEIHERAIDQLDKQIKRKLLLPDKLGFTESKGGTYNMSEIQFDILTSVIMYDHGRIEEVVNKELVRQLVDFNFPNVKAYPEMKFQKLDKKLRGDMLQILVSTGVVSPQESWIREYVNIPEPEDELAPNVQAAIDQAIPPQSISDASQRGFVPSTTTRAGWSFPQQNVPHQPTPGQGTIENIGASSQSVSPGMWANANRLNMPVGPGYMAPVPQARGYNQGTQEPHPVLPRPEGPMPAGMAITAVGKSGTAMWSAYSRPTIRDVYNFDAHSKDLDRTETDFLREYAEAHRAMGESLLDQVRRKKVIEDKDIGALKDVKLPKGDMKSLLAQYYAKLFLMGKANGIEQIRARLKKVRPQAFTFDYMRFTIDETDDGIDWLDAEWVDSYLKEYGDLGTLSKDDKAYLRSLKDRAFLVTGEIEARILKDAFQGIQAGLGDGTHTRELVAKLESLLEDDRKKYALTIARTNQSEAYNTAMMNLYMGDNVRPAVEAFLFSAILDNTTTEICRSLNNTIVYKDDPELARYQPPLHYNCRSTLIPILIGEVDNPDSFFYKYEDRFGELDHGVRPAVGFGA